MSEDLSMPSAPRRSGRHSHPIAHPSRTAAAALLTGAALALGLQAGGSRAEVLYTLDTKCARGGAAPVACKVEAINEAGATLYRHTIGATTHTLRISDQPARFSLWDGATSSWKPLRNAAVRFSTNTLCLNDTDLCVVNPNYLNSLLQERPDFRGRDLVRVRFAASGRVDILCYDTGCNLISARREAN
ncbi:MAG: hypothetical protein ACK587_05440 [Cyanobacteriota bacterium]|jgi:hypothetical protein